MWEVIISRPPEPRWPHARRASSPRCLIRTQIFLRPPSLSGAYFIDACPRAFEVILNWLRYKKVMLGTEAVAKDVIPVADYFGLHELCEELKEGKKIITEDAYDTIRLNVGGRIFETTRAILTSIPESQLAKMFLPDSKEILHKIINIISILIIILINSTINQ